MTRHIIPVLPDLLKAVMRVDVAKAAQWVGILSASYAVTQFFWPTVGSLSDQFGLLALCVDYLIMGYAHTIWLLLAGRLLAGTAGLPPGNLLPSDAESIAHLYEACSLAFC